MTSIAIGILKLVLLLSPFELNHQATEGDEYQFELDTSTGIRLWIAKNATKPINGSRAMRTVLIYIEPSDFKLDNLKKIGSIFSGRYPDPRYLKISIYADREMIKRAVALFHRKGPVFPTMRPEDFEARREELLKAFEQHYPRRSGYLRAHYTREEIGREYINYTLNPEKEELVLEIIVEATANN